MGISFSSCVGDDQGRLFRRTTPYLVGTARLGNNGVELVHFALSATHCSQTLLDKLAGALVHGVLDQFHAATLVWCKTGDLANELTDEFNTLATDLDKELATRTGG